VEDRLVWSYDDRRWLRVDVAVDVALVILWFGLLAYTLLAWQRLFGLGPEARPLQLIGLSACLFSSSLASVARRRSRRFFGALIVMSAAALAVSVVALINKL
jgi:hypothetical protein